MGLFDLLKLALGLSDPPAAPSVAAITIISSDSAKPASESPSRQAQG